MLSAYKGFRSAIAPYVMLVVGAMLALFTGPRLVSAIRASSRADSFVATPAHVLEWTTSRGRSHTYQELRFTYHVGAQRYEGTNQLTRDDDTEASLSNLISSHGGGRSLTVYYDPDSPEVVAVTREIEFDTKLLAFVVGLIITAVSAAIIRHRWRQPEPAPSADPAT